MKVVNMVGDLASVVASFSASSASSSSAPSSGSDVDCCSAGSEVEAWSSRGDEVVGGVVAEGGDLLFLGTLGSGLCAGQLASPVVS
ncbi:hypothetical protein CsSME_00031103 [Camellia sinensis var. sinensis]